MNSTMVSRTPFLVTFVVLSVAVGSYALLQSMVIPVLHQLKDSLDTDQAGVTWIFTANLLSASIFTPILGRVGDAVGKGKILTIVLIALSVGSVVAALASSLAVMLFGRVIQGAGGATLPLAFGIIRDEFPERHTALGISVTSALMGAASGLGITVAGPIVNAFGLDGLFWLPAIVTAVAAGVAGLFIPESPVRTPGRISFLPAVWLSGWLVAILLALSQGQAWGWSSPVIIGLLTGGVVLIGVWVISERRARVPLIDMHMMRLPGVWTTNLVALLVGVGMYATFAFVPEFLQTDPRLAGYGFDTTISQSGLILLPQAVMMFVLGLVSARISRVLGPKRAVVIGSAISATGLASISAAHSHVWQFYVANALLGIGIGLVFACLANLIVAAVPAQQTSVASGMNANIRTIGGAIGTAMMTAIVVSHPHASGIPSEAGFTIGFAALAAAMLAAAVAALLIPTVSEAELEERLESDELSGQAVGQRVDGELVAACPRAGNDGDRDR